MRTCWEVIAGRAMGTGLMTAGDSAAGAVRSGAPPARASIAVRTASFSRFSCSKSDSSDSGVMVDEVSGVPRCPAGIRSRIRSEAASGAAGSTCSSKAAELDPVRVSAGGGVDSAEEDVRSRLTLILKLFRSPGRASLGPALRFFWFGEAPSRRAFCMAVVKTEKLAMS